MAIHGGGFFFFSTAGAGKGELYGFPGTWVPTLSGGDFFYIIHRFIRDATRYQRPFPKKIVPIFRDCYQSTTPTRIAADAPAADGPRLPLSTGSCSAASLFLFFFNITPMFFDTGYA